MELGRILQFLQAVSQSVQWARRGGGRGDHTRVREMTEVQSVPVKPSYSSERVATALVGEVEEGSLVTPRRLANPKGSFMAPEFFLKSAG